MVAGLKRRRTSDSVGTVVRDIAVGLFLVMGGVLSVVLMPSAPVEVIGALLAVDAMLLMLYGRSAVKHWRLRQAKALLGRGYRLMRDGQVVQAQEKYAEAMQLYAKVGTKIGRAEALCRLGDLFRQQGKWEEARGRYDEALRLYETMGRTEQTSQVRRLIAECGS